MLLRARAPRPRAAARTAAMAGAGLLVLTGCEAPTPSVTVFTGIVSEHTEAVCWTEQDEAIEESRCVPRPGDVPALSYSVSETVGISVDPEIAEAGWRPYVATGTGAESQPLTDAPLDTSYYRFALPELSAEQAVVTLRIVALTGEGEAQAPRGVWLFTLRPS